MATPTLPIRDTVGAALRFVRAHWRFATLAAGLGAGASVLIAAVSLAASELALLGMVASGFVQAFVYAAFTAAALTGAAPARIASDGMRVWAAMVVIGLFLSIVFFLLLITATMVLFAGPLAPYLSDLQNAGQDQAAVMAVMTRFAEQNPGPLLAVLLVFGTVWLLLTSRLYLAAPASVEAKRILTFETWKWTKGAMVRIAAARLMVLLPANVLVGALGYLAARLFAIDPFGPDADGNVGGFLAYVFVAHFVTFALFSPLEAALSAFIYRGLKPPA
jgi:hypothetical protein